MNKFPLSFLPYCTCTNFAQTFEPVTLCITQDPIYHFGLTNQIILTQICHLCNKYNLPLALTLYVPLNDLDLKPWDLDF
jgi:hypothetical protein